jgi:outer membrane protein assembly factor BamB
MPEDRKKSLQQAWLATSCVAAVFVVLLGAGMLRDDRAIRLEDPLKSQRLKELKESLRSSPTDEKLKDSIRGLDLELRTKYFRHLSRRATGVYLLIGGGLALLVAAAQYRCLTRRLPMPAPRPDAAEALERVGMRSRWLVTGSGVVLAIALLASGARLAPDLPKVSEGKIVGMGQPDQRVIGEAPVEEYRQNWPCFRGPDGKGVWLQPAAVTNAGHVVLTAVVWKTAVPGAGFNSPIIWGDRIFFSGANEKERTVFCFDARTGQEVWRQAIGTEAAKPASAQEQPPSSGYAAATMATDGRRVYAFFGNGDLAALTLEGKPVWSKKLGPLKNAYGHSASLATWHGRAFLQLDQGEKEEGKSKLYAFDCGTGQTIWQHPRSVGSSWASPLVIEAGGKAQVITLAVPWVIAYSAEDGSELWRVDGLNGEVTPSAVYSAGLVLAISPGEKMMAIKPDGSGDVSKTHIAWTAEDGIPDITSPVCTGELVFTLMSSGTLTCFDAATGKKVWEHDYEAQFHSSPAIAGGLLYLASQKGTVTAVEVSREFKEVSRVETGDEFHASPAFMKDRMVLRGETNIWCFGQAPERIAGK